MSIGNDDLAPLASWRPGLRGNDDEVAKGWTSP